MARNLGVKDPGTLVEGGVLRGFFSHGLLGVRNLVGPLCPALRLQPFQLVQKPTGERAGTGAPSPFLVSHSGLAEKESVLEKVRPRQTKLMPVGGRASKQRS